jgi:hypothetical protein
VAQEVYGVWQYKFLVALHWFFSFFKLVLLFASEDRCQQNPSAQKNKIDGHCFLKSWKACPTFTSQCNLISTNSTLIQCQCFLVFELGI